MIYIYSLSSPLCLPSFNPLAKAPANRLKHFARAAIQESRDSLSSRLLEKAANTKCIKNAERDLHILLKRHGMTLPIQPTPVSFVGANKLEIPCLKLTTWWHYLLSTHPDFLMGGFQFGSMSQLLLDTYWQNMESCFPDHAVFTLHDRETRKRCIPFYLHMDEGVGLRKKAVLVMSAQAVFGLETQTRYNDFYTSSTVRTMDDAAGVMSRAQFHSARGSTYKSRFLFTAIPKKNYSKKNEYVFHGLLEELATECTSLMTTGVKIKDETFYGICMGMKGDAPALAKAGYFTRYFLTMGKGKGCCFECLAGLDGFEFEDCTANASWINTVGLEVPWKPNHVSPLVKVPGYKYSPELFFKRDPFHVFKQCLGGYFISSAIVVMGCDLGLFTFQDDSMAVKAVLERAYNDFEYYVKYEWRGKTINHLKSFTKETFHFPRVDSYPSARFKGSDCMMLLRWLRHLTLNGPVNHDHLLRPGCNLAEESNRPFELQLFKEVLKACSSGLEFFHIIHSEGIWLDLATAKQLADSCQTFCLSYCSLARLCFERGLTRFRLEPCLHQFSHFAVDIRKQLQRSVPFVHSPAPFLCEADEDFIGKICRGSRMVHAQSMTQRTMDRYKIKLWFEYSN